MTTCEKRDILIHFEEDHEEVIFYTVDSKSIENIRSIEFDGARSDIKWLQEKAPDEAERLMGSMVLSLIDTFSKKKINIRDYKSLNEIAHREYIQGLILRSEKNDPEAKYLLFVEHHSNALRNKSELELLKAEKYLLAAAKLGSQDAIERLRDDWDLMKDLIKKKIQRNNST